MILKKNREKYFEPNDLKSCMCIDFRRAFLQKFPWKILFLLKKKNTLSFEN